MISERILKLAAVSNTDDGYPQYVKIECDPADDDMEPAARTAKYLCKYLEAQTIVVPDNECLAGKIQFQNCPVPSNVFQRGGHAACGKAVGRFYLRTDDNLTCFEWEHSNGDFGLIIRNGIRGYLEQIEKSRKVHAGDTEKMIFLYAMEKTCHGLIDWANRWAISARTQAEQASDSVRKNELMRIYERLMHVPEFPARNFAEAVQSLFICWHFLPDSIGLADRYLRPFYEKEIADGTLTRDEAKELLQELFTAINGFTPKSSGNSDKGGESHFAVGGYLPDHTDGFCDLSRLLIESMMELPLYRPQVTLRWTAQTPTEVLRFALDCERHDKFKRIAFANDEPRIRGFTKYCGIPFEKACRYVMVGCNEPAFEGTIDLSGMTGNLARSITETLSRRRTEVCAAANFDEFLGIFRNELERIMHLINDRMSEFNVYRAGDVNVLSSIFIDGCIDRACSCTRGGSQTVAVSAQLMGFATTIDSLIAIRQFVYDEKLMSMPKLIELMDHNWKGGEELRARMQRDGKFFGSGDPDSNATAQTFTRMLAKIASGMTSVFGAPFVIGNLAGYNPHQTWFGKLTGATPDGRFAGDPLTLGTTPAGGHDLNGLTALLKSIAQVDPEDCMCGSCVFNLSLDRKLISDDDNFAKTVQLLETYFRLGGLHFQLNYVDRSELLDAQKNPDGHQDLRVRVSGFSGYFVRLSQGMQDDVISRTEQK